MRIGRPLNAAISNRGNSCMVGGCWTMLRCNAGNATGDRANNTDLHVSWTQRAVRAPPWPLNATHGDPTGTQCNNWFDCKSIGGRSWTAFAEPNQCDHMPSIPKHDTNWRPRKKQAGRKHIESRYNTRQWRRLRAAFLSQFPCCDECGRVASVVDHIKQVTKGGAFWTGPFRPLCKRCHDVVSGRQRHGVETPPRRQYPFGDGPS